MRAAVLHPGGALAIEERPRPEPGAGEILVESRAVGICGSDLHYYKEGHIGDWWIREPHVLGHEFAGIVAEVGEGVDRVEPGDRVAIEPIIPCDTCGACRQGTYNLCSDFRFTGSPHTDGALQEYVLVPGASAHKLPSEMSFPLAALVEPTSIAVHAVRQSGLKAGDTVTIIGAGPIGLLILGVAMAYEAEVVNITDVNDVRLGVAKELGATAAINVAGLEAADIVARTTPGGVDIAFEAVGDPLTLETAMHTVLPGGRVVAVGVNSSERIPFNLMLAQAKEITLCPVYLGRDAFPEAIDLLASGQIRGDLLVSHRFALEEAVEGLDAAAGGSADAIKVMIEPTGGSR